MLVLSLFPGIGLLDRAFEEAGFCVVRGPDKLWGGDVKTFHPPVARFDGLVGGPPCQAFSRLRHIVEANGYATAQNLIPEFERVAREARPKWFVMENVPAAPEPIVAGYTVTSATLNNRWFGGVQHRERRFSFGVDVGRIDPWEYLEVVALEAVEWQPAVCASSGGRAVPVKLGGSGKVKSSHRKGGQSLTEAIRLQGLPEGFLDDAPFTVAGKLEVVGNGVPLPMGRAVADVILAGIYGRRREVSA